MFVAVDYISFAHNETQKSVPDGLKELSIRGLSALHNFFISKNATESSVSKGNFIERILSKFFTRISNDFVTINLEMQAIHDKLINGELKIENPEKDFETIKKIIKLLTRADNFFMEINYFGNENLKAELKSSLHTTYLIEVEFKELVYKGKRNERKKDELFSAFAAKSKQSLSRVF